MPSVLLHHQKLTPALLLAADLRRRGYRVEACSSQPNSALRHSRHISAFHHVPSLAEPERLADNVCEIVRTRHIGMFLPVSDEVFALAPYRDRLAAETRYPFESAPTLARVHNKVTLQRDLRAAGLLTPHAEPWDLGPLPSTLQYPVVVKDIAGAGALGYQLIRNEANLAQARAARRASGIPAMLQQFITGRDLQWMGVLHNGRLAQGFSGERLLMTPAAAGPSVLRRALHCPELDRQGESLLAHLNYRGFASLDLVQDHEGRYWFLDFNPRFCAAFHTTLQAGLSFADLLYRLADEQPATPTAPPKPSHHSAAPTHTRARPGAQSLSLARLAQRLRQSPAAWPSTLAALRALPAAEELYPLDPLPLLAAAWNRLAARIPLPLTAKISPLMAPLPSECAYSEETYGKPRTQPSPLL